MKIHPCFWFLALWIGVTSAPAASNEPLRLSLKDCLEMARENNGKIRAAGYAIEGAEWRLNEAHARFKPVIEWNNRMAPVPLDAQSAASSFFSGDLTFFNSSKLGIGLPVYAFGKLDTAQALAAQGIEAAKQKQVKQQGEVAFEVKQLYFGILLGAELNHLVKDAIGKIDNQLAKEEEKPEHSPYDLAKLKTFKLELERRLAEVVEKATLAREAMRLAIGLLPDETFVLTEQFLDPASVRLEDFETYADRAAVLRPEARLVDIGIRAKQLEWQLEKRQLLPNIGLGGFAEIGRTVDTVRNLQATDDFNDPFNYTRAGVGLEIKGEFDVHGKRARMNRLRSEYHQALMEESLAQSGLALEVRQVYEEAKRFQENLQRAEERRKLARQMVFLSKTAIDVGVGEEEQYTDALQLLLLTRGEYYKAVFDYNVAVAKLEWKSGGGGIE